MLKKIGVKIAELQKNKLTDRVNLKTKVESYVVGYNENGEVEPGFTILVSAHPSFGNSTGMFAVAERSTYVVGKDNIAPAKQKITRELLKEVSEWQNSLAN